MSVQGIAAVSAVSSTRGRNCRLYTWKTFLFFSKKKYPSENIIVSSKGIAAFFKVSIHLKTFGIYGQDNRVIRTHIHSFLMSDQE